MQTLTNNINQYDTLSVISAFNKNSPKYMIEAKFKNMEAVRRYLFQTYMGDLAEVTSAVKKVKSNEEIKNAETEVKMLMDAFEKSSVNRNLLDKREKSHMQPKRLFSAINTQILTKQYNEQNKEFLKKTVDTIQNIKRINKIFQNRCKSKSFEIVKNADSFKSKFVNDEHFTEESVNYSSKIKEMSLTDFKEVSLISLENTESPRTDDIENQINTNFIKNEEPISTTSKLDFFHKLNVENERFYIRNRKKFMKNSEKAHKSMFDYSRKATAELNENLSIKKFPQMRSITDLNLNTEILKKRVQLKKFNSHIQEVNNTEIQDGYSSKEDDENDEKFIKTYRKRLNKREEHIRSLEVMYNKAVGYQQQVKHMFHNDYESSQTPNVFQINAIKREIKSAPIRKLPYFFENDTIKEKFRISNAKCSNYEVFIPKIF
jgi:hypothetical protein